MNLCIHLFSEHFAVKGVEKTILILGAHHSVFSQAADMLDEPIVMYRTKERIRGECFIGGFKFEMSV